MGVTGEILTSNVPQKTALAIKHERDARAHTG